MYCDFYQLTERPFNVTPDPKFLYLNARYREAIASLNYGISQRRGFITLIGEAGTGKTTLLKRLLEDLDETTRTVFIFNTNVSFEEILEYIFAEFDLPVHNGKKLYMLQRLNTFLLEELRQGRNVALLIDEAQDLEFSVLEDLRLLSNLETAKEKILQIVLSGQPELGQKLSNPVLRQLRQRIGINCRLLPLSREEITEYIHYRLEAAGCPDVKLFSRDAEDLIYQLSRGIPRLVNVVCDNALVIGYALGKKRIGADVVSEAAADLLPAEMASETLAPETDVMPVAPVSRPAPRDPARLRRFWQGAGLAAGSVMAVGGLWVLGRTVVQNWPTAGGEMPEPTPVRLEVIRPGGGQAPVRESARGLGDSSTAPSGGLSPRGAGREAEDALPLELAASGQTGGARGAEAGAEVAPSDVAGEGDALARLEAAVAAVREERPGSEPSVEPLPDTAGRGVAAVEAEPLNPAWEPAAEERRVGDSGASPSGAASRLRGVRLDRFVVHPGDSLSAIARRKYGQSSYTVLDLLMLANPGLRDIDVISPGQELQLPELADGFPVLDDGAGGSELFVFSSPHSTRAAGMVAALRRRGFNGRTTEGSLGGGKRVYRVTVGGGATATELDRIGVELQRVFREDPAVATVGE